MKQLKEFQKDGVFFLNGRKRSILADEMGLGKTVQALLHAAPFQRVLIIAPAFLCDNWQQEAKAWRCPPVQVIETGRDAIRLDWLAVSFELAQKFYRDFIKMRFDLIIIDEAHYLKSPESSRTGAILGTASKPGLIGRADRTVFLTGSPLVNHAGEIYPILKRCLPQTLKGYDYKKFCLKFCYTQVIYQKKEKIIPRKVRNPKELRALLDHVMLRRKKKDVLPELPAKRKQIVELGPDARLRELLKEESGYSLADFEKSFPQDLPGELQSVLADADDPFSLTPLATLRREIGLAKVPLIVPHLENDLHELPKIVVFAWHKEVIYELADQLNDYNPVFVTGDVPKKKRPALITAFQEDSDVRIFIGQMKAAGVGLTLTAASHVYFAEPWYVPGDLEQAIDRVHRIGQKNSVLAKFFIIPGTLDAKVLDSAFEKEKYLEKVI